MQVNNKQLIAILNRIADMRTVTMEGSQWVIEEKDLPETMEVEVKDE